MDQTAEEADKSGTESQNKCLYFNPGAKKTMVYFDSSRK